MTAIKLFLAALLFFCNVSDCFAQISTLFERKVGRFASVALITDEAINSESLKKLYYHYSSLQKSEVFQLQLFTNRSLAIRLLGGKIGTDRDRADWLKEYKAFESSRATIDMGEVVRVGRDVVMRTILDNKVSQEVLSGKNPLTCLAAGNTCEIIWIAVGRVPPSQPHYSEPMVNLFVLLGRLPTSDEARSIFNSLRERFPTKLLAASFRSDPWFIDDLEFPLVYPFLLPGLTEDSTSIGAGKAIMCLESLSGVKCQ